MSHTPALRGLKPRYQPEESDLKCVLRWTLIYFAVLAGCLVVGGILTLLFGDLS